MRLAVNESREESEASIWAALPGLCCEAAGGEAARAFPLAAAWTLLHEAASITDNVEDRDPPADWWAQSGSAVALSVATGLYFSACQALNQLESAVDALTARDVRDEALRRVLEMCSGQHLDLTQPRPSLATYWQVARAKSGAFFGMACWTGARLATEAPQALQGFQEFGVQLGLLIQILDDLKEYQALEHNTPVSGVQLESLPDLRRSLPAAYVREVAPPEAIERFEQLLENPTLIEDASLQIVQTIERFGGAAYVLAELEIKRTKALEGLEMSGARPPARDGLLRLLEAVYTPD